MTAVLDERVASPAAPAAAAPVAGADRPDHLGELRRAVASLARRSTSDTERWLLLGGAVLVPAGVLAVLAGYWGAANAPRVIQQIPYQISGGLLGLALVFAGSFSYFAWWLTRIVREQQRVAERIDAQTVALTAELAALRRALATASGGDASTLVTTPNGTLAHRPSCRVVVGRTDLRPAPTADRLCKSCHPAAT